MIMDPGEPGNYLLNDLQLADGSVMKMEDGSATAVTWVVMHARGTDAPESIVVHHYALDDAQLLHLITMLVLHAERRGLVA